MDQVLQNIPGVCCYIDDILITAPNEAQHLMRLEAVLERLKKFNIRSKREKCIFLAPKVEYLGHVLSKEGCAQLPDKVQAINAAKEPKDVSELRTFLGCVNYYGKFLENLSTILAPLNRLLQDDIPWKWSRDCKEAFQKIKADLSSDRLLVHYDANKELVLACDASPYGIGAVLSHVMENGEERTVAFASHSHKH